MVVEGKLDTTAEQRGPVHEGREALIRRGLGEEAEPTRLGGVAQSGRRPVGAGDRRRNGTSG